MTFSLKKLLSVYLGILISIPLLFLLIKIWDIVFPVVVISILAYISFVLLSNLLEENDNNIAPNASLFSCFKCMSIPWGIAILITAFYSAGTIMLYSLSFFFRNRFTWKQLGMHPDDAAGYISYILSGIFCLIFCIIFTRKYRFSLQTGMPNGKHFILPIALSTIVMIIPWTTAGLFFSSYVFSLPGDGNWPAIFVFSGLTVLHALLLTILAKLADIAIPKDFNFSHKSKNKLDGA